MAFYTYILASKRNGTLYVGSTADLRVRIFDHKEGTRPGFSQTYGVYTLVWFEAHETREGANTRERQIKEWRTSLETATNRRRKRGMGGFVRKAE